jgi:hypothetical protein
MARNQIHLALLVLAFVATGAIAQNTKTVNWVVPANGQSSSETIPVGGSITFTWTSQHDLWETPSSSCPATFTNGSGITQLAPASRGGSRTVQFPTAGTRYFACSVSTHCQEGQHITVTVGSAAPAPGPSRYGQSYGGGATCGGNSSSGSGYGGSSGSGSNYTGNSTYGGAARGPTSSYGGATGGGSYSGNSSYSGASSYGTNSSSYGGARGPTSSYGGATGGGSYSGNSSYGGASSYGGSKAPAPGPAKANSSSYGSGSASYAGGGANYGGGSSDNYGRKLRSAPLY